jgi:hypothetical protein
MNANNNEKRTLQQICSSGLDHGARVLLEIDQSIAQLRSNNNEDNEEEIKRLMKFRETILESLRHFQDGLQNNDL